MSWDEYYLNMLELMASKSKDKSTKVGVIIVGPDNEIRSTGFNSFPRGINDDLEERQLRPAKYLYIEHGERNAIYNAARVGVPLNGCRIYMDKMPCADCSRAIIQCGINKIIIKENSDNNSFNERWKDSFDASVKMLKEAGVEQISIETGSNE